MNIKISQNLKNLKLPLWIKEKLGVVTCVLFMFLAMKYSLETENKIFSSCEPLAARSVYS